MAKSKKTSPLKIILIALPLTLIAACGAIAAPLFIRYHSNAYEKGDIVDYTGTYVMPEYPDVILDPDATADLEDTEPAEILPDESEPTLPEESQPEDSTTPAESETLYPETLAPIITVPDRPSTGSDTKKPSDGTSAPATTTKKPENTVHYDDSASFANSPNARSVYGKTPIYKKEQKDPDVVNYLVIGTDTRDVNIERGRSDVTMVVSYNKKAGTVKLVSLLRDSLIPIEGHDWNRINTCYAFDGVGLAINTINQLYDLDIQRFVVIDFNGTKDFIRYVGDVDLYLTAAEAEYYNQSGTNFHEGMNTLNADQALMHMRNRTVGSDFQRTARQRQTITAILKKIVTEMSLPEIYDLLGFATTLIKTNISSTELVSLAASVFANASSLTIDSQSVPYSDAYQSAWYKGMAILTYDIADAAKRINAFLYP